MKRRWLQTVSLALTVTALASDPAREDTATPTRGVLRSRWAQIAPDALTKEALKPDARLRFRAFDDVRLQLRVSRVLELLPNVQAVYGTVEGSPFGAFFLTAISNSVLMVVEDPPRKWVVRPAGRFHLVEEREPSSEEILPDGEPPRTPTQSLRVSPRGGSGGATVDVMVVYTPAARSWANSWAGGIDLAIGQAMTRLQQASDNSNLGITFRMVHSSEISYTESGNTSTDLDRLRDADDGYMDEVHVWRNTYGADLVGLITLTYDVGGMGYLLTTAGGAPDWAFSISRVQQVYNSFTFAHEVGHNMGAHHRKDQAESPGPGLFSYSAGWRWIGTNGTRYCSVMSYTDAWAGNPVYQVGHFSSPLVQHQGAATGHPADGDNARTLREIAPVISAYRASVRRIVKLGSATNFGALVIGQKAQRMVSIANEGTDPLRVERVDVPSPFAAAWTGVLAAGTATNVTVSFAPNRRGFHAVSLTVRSDATGGRPTQTLWGYGIDTNEMALAVTNVPSGHTVGFSTTSIVLRGWAGVDVAGWVSYTNPQAGYSGVAAATSSWSTAPIPLTVGTNAIQIRGTNNPVGHVHAADSATNTPYWDGWQSGDNGGHGFGPWVFELYGTNAGHFRATTNGNPNLRIGPAAWGLWANSGDTAAAWRWLLRPLVPTNAIRLRFQNNWIETDRSVGVAFQNADAEYLLEFMFIGGREQYTINDQSGGWNTSVPYTDAGLSLTFELLGPETYRLRVGTNVIEGTLKARTNMVIARVRFWNYSAGPGDPYNFYINDLVVTGLPETVRSAATTTLIVRLAPTPPMIVRHPEDAEAHEGERVGLYIAAEGDPPLNYQWRKDGTPYPATGTSLVWQAVTLSDTGYYDCVVSNPGGAVTSTAARVSVTRLALLGHSFRVERGQVVLGWQALSNRRYDIWWSSNLIEGFQPRYTNLTGTPPLLIITDLVHEAESRGFYHIRSSAAD